MAWVTSNKVMIFTFKKTRDPRVFAMFSHIIYPSNEPETTWDGRGVLGSAGVGGASVLARFRFQKPVFGPCMTNSNVHLDRPRSESGRYVDAVSNVARDSTNVKLIKEHFVNNSLCRQGCSIPFS